jgi:hypothetical protein
VNDCNERLVKRNILGRNEDIIYNFRDLRKCEMSSVSARENTGFYDLYVICVISWEKLAHTCSLWG